MLLTIVTFVVALSILVIGHELGHFLMARHEGVTVDEFGLGYPPRIATIAVKNGVQYTINAIPLGGFVRLRGEEEDAGEGSFLRASPKSRLMILLAGPLASAIVAIFFMTIAYVLPHPVPVNEGARIVAVAPGSPAEQSGLRPEDVIVALNGEPIRTVPQLISTTKKHLGERVTLTVHRDGEVITVKVLARKNPPSGQGSIGVTVTAVMAMKPEPIWNAVRDSILATLKLFWLTLVIPIWLLRGMIPWSAARPVGPVSIARITGSAMSTSLATGQFYHIFFTVGFISAALAVTNLLPLPALDGGRALFVIVEMIRGKKIEPKKEAWVHAIGMMILIFLMVVVTYIDITHPINISSTGF